MLTWAQYLVVLLRTDSHPLVHRASFIKGKANFIPLRTIFPQALVEAIQVIAEIIRTKEAAVDSLLQVPKTTAMHPPHVAGVVLLVFNGVVPDHGIEGLIAHIHHMGRRHKLPHLQQLQKIKHLWVLTRVISLSDLAAKITRWVRKSQSRRSTMPRKCHLRI